MNAKDKPTIRIYGLSSFISAIYTSIYHKSTVKENDITLIVLDQLEYKSPHKDNILAALTQVNYNYLIDLSTTLSDTADRIPSQSKKLTRRLKTKPVFKQLYNFLYRLHQHRESRKLTLRLRDEINDLNLPKNYRVEVIIQPMHYALKPLESIFPSGQFYYCEHGVGDYLDIYQHFKFEYPFLNVFHHKWAPFVQGSGQSLLIMSPDRLSENEAYFKSVFSTQFEVLSKQIDSEKPIIILCLQALENYGIDLSFWVAFLSECMAQIVDIDSMQILIKPHPYQSQIVLDGITSHITTLGIEYHVLDQPELETFSIELIYTFVRLRVRYFISPFSSAIFYLAHFYSDTNTTFIYSIKDVYLNKNAPDLYKKRWQELEQWVHQLFNSPGLVELG